VAVVVVVVLHHILAAQAAPALLSSSTPCQLKYLRSQALSNGFARMVLPVLTILWLRVVAEAVQIVAGVVALVAIEQEQVWP
jgi:hypothetical protein